MLNQDLASSPVSRSEVVTLDPNDPDQVRAAAELHRTLLGHSPIPRLGLAFMTEFFYSHLVRDGLIHCYLYRLNGEYVGFLSLTETPATFLSEGKRKHLARLSLLLGVAVLARPSRTRILLETLAAGRHKSTHNTKGTGEILSFGVLERAVSTRHKKDDVRISTALFDTGISHFRERGFHRVEWTVDEDNLPAMIFYRSYGATMERTRDAWPSDYRVWLEL